MVVAASRPTETRTAFVLPLDVLAAAWPILTVLQGQPRNPYKGLRPFTQRDAADFFGREAVVEKVAELVNSLVTEQPARSSTRLLTILGPSGAGKSSLVMAGLLPQLQRGMLPGSEKWLCLDPIVPGTHPLESLVLTLAAQQPDRSFSSIREDLENESARGLHQLCTHLLNIHRREQPGARVILLVDQFEELFTQTESEDERQRFIQLLLTACSEPRGPLMVLLTLRADFYDRPMQYPDLFRLIDTQHLPLLAIEPVDLRRVIEQPTALPDVQVTFEGDLVNRLLSDVQGQVGALPLLQFTLDQLFQRRSGRQLTLSAYRELGGLKGALTRQAEETYTTLPSEEHRKLARALFVRLIDPGATEQDTTRRRAALSEFSMADATKAHLMRETIDAFIAARLLTTNEIAGTTTIEVSNEALIREWPRIAEWLREARDDIRLQQTISKNATEWERRNKPRDRLYRGSQLKEAKVWARRNSPSGNEVAFLRAGAAQRMFYVVRTTLIVLLMLSMAGLAGRLGFLSLNPPDPTHVINLQDDGVGSLRWAIANAPLGSTIMFNASLRVTILLTSGNLNIGRNLTIRGLGAGTISISSRKSGAIVRVIQGASITISGLTFEDSKTSNSFIDNEGTLTLSNSTISGNTVTGLNSMGGSIYNSGTLTLINSTVSDNSATGDGGGIYNNGTLTLANSTISDNTATGIGRPVSDNTATGLPSMGGGIYNSRGTLTNSTVSGNKAIEGGGINNYGQVVDGITTAGMLTLTNSTISDNTATGPHSMGGGITIFSSEIDTTGTIPVQVMLLYCTVYGNTASGGGGIWIDNFNKQSQVTMRASVAAGNNAHSGPDIAGRLTTLGYNMVGDTSGATFLGSPKVQSTDMLGVSSTDLIIDPVLRDNGGSTNPHTRTHALLPGSPAIDAIPLQYCQVQGIFNSRSRMYTDQRGMKRPDGNESACDIGAYESSP
jgi:hypothetical protein